MKAGINGYYATWGPRERVLLYLYCDHAALMSVVGQPDPVGMDANPVGTARCVGWIEGTEPPVAVFRLVVGGRQLPGEYVCDRRRFVALERRPELLALHPRSR